MIQRPYPPKVTHAAIRLRDMLEQQEKPVVAPFDFFRVVWRMYTEPAPKNLYLRDKFPDKTAYSRLKRTLQSMNVIGADRDYGARVIRVLSVSDRPADDIVCLVDPTCHVSHLSAMQRWGLTNRNPIALMLTRPNRADSEDFLRARRDEALDDGETNPFRLPVVRHPARVRGRPVSIHESKAAGKHINIPGTAVRLSTIGQTFLDMVQAPQLCGGMSHAMDVWEEHAETYLEEIVAAVNDSPSKLAQSRAGYILEEHLGLRHPAIEAWKALGQRGGSRKLDPAQPFAPEFSETWMLSINA